MVAKHPMLPSRGTSFNSIKELKMRAVVAKRIRRKVYGKGHHPGPITYSPHQRRQTTRVSDRARWDYQQAKKEYIKKGQ